MYSFYMADFPGMLLEDAEHLRMFLRRFHAKLRWENGEWNVYLSDGMYVGWIERI